MKGHLRIGEFRPVLLLAPVLLSALVTAVLGCDRSAAPVSTPIGSTSGGEQEAAAETSPETEASKRSSLNRIRRLIAAGDFPSAASAVRSHLTRDPDDPDALDLAGKIALQTGDDATAIDLLRRALERQEQASAERLLDLSTALLSDHRPFESIEILREGAAAFPNRLGFRQNLASVLAQVGLQDRAAEHLRWLVKHQQASLSVLLMLSDLTRPQEVESLCRSALKKHPQDLRPQYALALREIVDSKWATITGLLKPVVEKHPSFLPAMALYGRALVELNEQERVARWAAALPPEIEDEPQYWMAAGTWASRNKQFEHAARAYWSAVKLNEDDPEALNQLSLCLSQLGRESEAAVAAERAKKIVELRSQIKTLGNWNFQSQKNIVDLSLTLQDLGRPWEAIHWMILASQVRQHPDPRFASAYQQLRSALTASTPWQIPEQTVSRQMDLSSLPAIAWTSAESTAPTQSQPSVSIDYLLHDESRDRTLQHLCSIGRAYDDKSGLMIYESGAGGAGVVDYDLDGWPDLYLTVIDGTPGLQDSAPNRLHRNQSGQFVDVTEAASLLDRGYSQGVAVGDYNADGWPDVYVGNIGQNRLFRNNGDGTFRDVTRSVGIVASTWTTSVAIVDVNSDGHADLFDVGYCSGREALTRQCIEESLGHPRSCNPMAFDAEPDRIWAGSGDGRFSPKPPWLDAQQPGRGFALVVGDFDQQSGLEIYVANDMTANHYWAVSDSTTKTSATETPFRLSDQAPIRGLAFNRRSDAQASMGIAAADADRDGDTDFFLTHFWNDHNTFYRQYRPGAWSDESRACGFVKSSKPMLAYGTQWMDVDNDGSLELLIANGDIDDFSHAGRRFRQRPQLLAQNAPGHWSPVAKEHLSDYFTTDRLARAVATLDANRDGFTDSIVTHLFDPVALLINQTRTDANQVRFFLRATNSHRDAIGTRIRIEINDQHFEQQLMAGNGFQCANEACVVFGVGQAESVDGVKIKWPDGTSQRVGPLAAGSDVLLIQGFDAEPLQ